jgi:hypothetical protein
MALRLGISSWIISTVMFRTYKNRISCISESIFFFLFSTHVVTFIWRAMFDTGLPDGIFSYQKSYLGIIWEDLGIVNAGNFIYNLEYFTPVWYIFSHVAYFPVLVCCTMKKIWQPWFDGIK